MLTLSIWHILGESNYTFSRNNSISNRLSRLMLSQHNLVLGSVKNDSKTLHEKWQFYCRFQIISNCFNIHSGILSD